MFFFTFKLLTFYIFSILPVLVGAKINFFAVYWKTKYTSKLDKENENGKAKLTAWRGLTEWERETKTVAYIYIVLYKMYSVFKYILI